MEPRGGGRTWRDHALSDSSHNLYSIGGARSVATDGGIVGTFTDQAGSNALPDRKSRVWFFQIPGAGAGLRSGRPLETPLLQRPR